MSKWRFPSNDYGEKKGINDSGIATFRGTPLRSLAREICQNSLDAARDKTVRIEFNAFDITSDKLPGSDILKDCFDPDIEIKMSFAETAVPFIEDVSDDKTSQENEA